MKKEDFDRAVKIIKEIKKKESILNDWREAIEFGGTLRLVSRSPDTNRTRHSDIDIPKEYFGDIKKIMVGRLEYDIQRLQDEFDKL